ncbi:protein SCAI [Asparagus officinalis]|uniref:protein SCAI n=1 Tax=Asparagus officinalis TaxID=4686 RepID=UPI00098E7CBE|nr:protein SCAI [Asparagus officinalis]
MSSSYATRAFYANNRGYNDDNYNDDGYGSGTGSSVDSDAYKIAYDGNDRSNSWESGNIPIAEIFWSLIDKADRKFSKVRDLPNYARNRNDSDFHKAFKIYTQLWKLQQENRQKLVDAGLKRWEIGEIASRIAQLYYGQYQRTSDSGYLSEAFVFYEAILSREYFRGEGLGLGQGQQELGLMNKQMRFLARFLTVCLVIGRREMVSRLAGQLKGLVDECKKNFQETEFREWKHVVQEIIRFLKADSSFMNMRPLRYCFAYDTHPDSLLSAVPFNGKRRLVLRDAILSSYYHNEVKFTELTLDTFRVLQCLEWEPSGFFSLKGGADNSHNGIGPNRLSPLQDIRDPTLPPNPRKVILYRPSVTHLLVVLSTICEELPSDGILLIYLSAAGDCGVNYPTKLSSGISQNAAEKIVQGSDLDAVSPSSSPVNSPPVISSHKDDDKGSNEGYLWLGSRGSKGVYYQGSNYFYPCDLIPFTRKPLFLVVDSNNSCGFKAIHGEEKGETAIMLLSPISRAPSMVASTDSTRYQHGSQFTMFLTAPVQAFCLLVGMSGMDIDKDTYDKAEKLFSLSLSEWEKALVSSDSLHPVWDEVLADPFLRRLVLRFIFCRAVLALYSPTYNREEFLPSCLPHLPASVSPDDPISQSAVLRLAGFFGAAEHFSFSQGISVAEGTNVEVLSAATVGSSDTPESHSLEDKNH